MDKSRTLKEITLINLVWKFIERLGVQGVQFIVQIILARLLIPEDYGIISLIVIIISVSNVIIQSGFTTSLIQKKDTDELDFSSVFYVTLSISVLLYIVIYVYSPFISKFYNKPIIEPVLRVLSLNLLLGAFNSIQNTIISKTMQFKKLVSSSMIASILSGTIGIILAYKNAGVWALVAQQLSSQVITVLILWFSIKWRPKLLFSISRVKLLFSFGANMLISGLLDVLYNNIRNLIIGKMYTASMLGIYNRGEQFPQLIVNNIDGSIQSVMLPILSDQQENKTVVKNIVRKSIRTSSFIILPIMIGMAAMAESIVKLLLTDKWLDCVEYIRIFCFTYALMPVHTANLQAIKALGYSNIFLKLEIVKKAIGIFILLITVNNGVHAIALGVMVSGIISAFINSYPNKRLIDYKYNEQIKDILPLLINSIIMGLIVYSINYINIEPVTKLFIQLFIGIFVYIIIAYIFKDQSFEYILRILKNLKNKSKNNNIISN